jgi:hypothetical protein
MIPLTLLLKIAIPPVLVAFMSLAARRFGPTFGGLIMGLPWMTGPVLFFLALDRGDDFVVRACTGVELATLGISAFLLAFGLASRWLPWWGCIAVAITTYGLAGLLTQGIETTLGLATLAAATSLLVTYSVMPRPKSAVKPSAPPRWDIAARMAATFALVAGIMSGADLLGPQRSGILASFPVIVTVIGSFTQAQSGSDAVLRALRGVSLSLLAFAAFFFVLGSSLPTTGLVSAFALSALTALTISALLITWNVWSIRRA